VMITWYAHDKHLASQPISLYYAESGKGPWTPIATGMANTGRYLWEPPPDFPEAAQLRIQVVDRAGNVAIAERSIQRSAPAPVWLEGKISRVEPADGQSP